MTALALVDSLKEEEEEEGLPLFAFSTFDVSNVIYDIYLILIAYLLSVGQNRGVFLSSF